MNIPVLLVSNFLSASGGSRGVCEELAIRLKASGASVITTSAKQARIPRLFDMLRTIISQRRNYAMAHVDVYSGPAFVWAEATCAMLRRLKKPFLLTLHGGNLPQFAQRFPGRVQRLLPSANVVTAPSEYLREKMLPYCDGIRLLVNSLDTAVYPFRLRKPARPSLIWLRSFHDIYNPLLAPKVVAQLAHKFPDVHLTMVGPDKKDGSLQRTLQSAVALGVMDRICLAGGVAKSEVPMWMNRGDVFLNTTNVDNTPVSVLEAMACGLCVVSTNVGGLPYLLNNGHDAILVPPDNAERMAEAIERILTNPTLAERLSQNARVKAEEHDWSVVLPQWKSLYESNATF